MAVGFPRSVLSGTARHGADIIRQAILRRRRIGDSYGGNDPYQVRPGGAYLPGPARAPGGTTPPPAAPAPRPVTPTKGYIPPDSTYTAPPRSTFYDNFGGIGGAGGSFDKKGKWNPYDYVQEAGGKYSGWNTFSSLDKAVTGKTQSEIDRLDQQALDYYAAYDAAHGAVTGRAATGRDKALASARGVMPRYGTLAPELQDVARAAAGGYTPEEFADMPIDPRVFGKGAQAPISYAYQTAYGLPHPEVDPLLPPMQPINATRVTPVKGTARGLGSTGLDVALGGTWAPQEVQTRAWKGAPTVTSYVNAPTGTNVLPAEPAMGERREDFSYDPHGDWQRVLGTTGAKQQYTDLQGWEQAQLADLDQQYAPTFADIEQYNSIPRNIWDQNVAVNAYGMDPSLAAGQWDEDWQRDFERGALTDELGMLNTQNALAGFDENGQPIPDQMTPGQMVSNQRAIDAWNTYQETGQWPEDLEQGQTEYEQAQQQAIYGELDQGFGGVDSNAVLQAANLTPEQGLQILRSGEYQAAVELLNEALDEDGQLDELAADERMRDIRREGGPAVAALIEALFPEMVSENYLVP